MSGMQLLWESQDSGHGCEGEQGPGTVPWWPADISGTLSLEL